MSVQHIEEFSDHEHDEGYFASFTDLLVGVLFIFIILLMVFASNFSKAVDEVTGANESRKVVLEEIQKSMEEQGVSISIDTEQGILRLPEEVLFARNQSSLNQEGRNALSKLAVILKDYLPCLAHLKIPDDKQEGICTSLKLKSRNSLETVLIEGHTDYTGTIDRNWQLSAERAVTVFRSLTSFQPVLDNGIVAKITMNGAEREIPVLAISGYADRRPLTIDSNKAEADLKKDRRIDLRFVMRAPTPDEVKTIQKTMEVK